MFKGGFMVGCFGFLRVWVWHLVVLMGFGGFFVLKRLLHNS
jgi:hypothetical protein